MSSKNTGADLERWGVRTIASSLCLLGEIPVPGRMLTRSSFSAVETLRLKGYFHEEFLKGLGRGIYVPPATLRVHQVVRCACTKHILREIPRELALISPAHFLGYISYARGVYKLFTRLPIRNIRMEAISFSVGRVHKSVLIMRALCTANGMFEISVEGVSSSRVWAPGTHIISRCL